MNLNNIALVLLLTLWCCKHSSTERSLNLINPKLVQMLNLKQKFPFRRDPRSDVDLRGHKLFTSNPHLDCCPTKTEVSHRTFGINPQGLVLELFHLPNFTQTFYETICLPAIKDRPCQFIDRRYVKYSRCVQQYSYVYAMARTFGNWYEQFRIDFIRIATGCKCQLQDADLSARYSNRILNTV